MATAPNSYWFLGGSFFSGSAATANEATDMPNNAATTARAERMRCMAGLRRWEGGPRKAGGFERRDYGARRSARQICGRSRSLALPSRLERAAAAEVGAAACFFGFVGGGELGRRL